MRFMKAILDMPPEERYDVIGNPKATGEDALKGLEALCLAQGLDRRLLIAAMNRELAFFTEHALIGYQNPGDPNDDTRAMRIVEIILDRRNRGARNDLVEYVYGNSLTVIEGAINAGVSRPAAQAALLELIMRNIYKTNSRGDIVPAGSPD